LTGRNLLSSRPLALTFIAFGLVVFPEFPCTDTNATDLSTERLTLKGHHLWIAQVRAERWNLRGFKTPIFLGWRPPRPREPHPLLGTILPKDTDAPPNRSSFSQHYFFRGLNDLMPFAIGIIMKFFLMHSPANQGQGLTLGHLLRSSLLPNLVTEVSSYPQRSYGRVGVTLFQHCSEKI